MKDPQKLINEWCDKYEVPQIQVVRVKRLNNCQAYFNPNYYELVIKNDVTIKILQHEFTHYLLRLINVAQQLEEEICNKMEEVRL